MSQCHLTQSPSDTILLEFRCIANSACSFQDHYVEISMVSKYWNRCQILLRRLTCILVLPTSAYAISFQACSLAPMPSFLYREFIYRYSGDSFFCNYTYPFSSLVSLPSSLIYGNASSTFNLIDMPR